MHLPHLRELCALESCRCQILGTQTGTKLLTVACDPVIKLGRRLVASLSSSHPQRSRTHKLGTLAERWLNAEIS
jgi:hypothetical protein